MAKLFFILAFFAVSSAHAADDLWESTWKDCAGLGGPHFQKNRAKFKTDVIGEGKKWEAALPAQKAKLARLVNVSCPAYLANPNGNTSLQSFTAEYTQVSLEALALKQQSDAIEAFFGVEAREAEKYFSEFGVAFEGAPCGKAFERTKAHIAEETKFIEDQFGLLKSKCPAIAEAAATASVSQAKGSQAGKALGKSAPGGGAKGKGSPQEQSTITGVKPEPSLSK